MPRDKMLLSMPTMGRPRRRIWPWILAGIVLIIAIYGIYTTVKGSTNTAFATAQPIDNDSMGMDEWSDMDDLMRQSMNEIQNSEDPANAEETEVNEDPFLIRGRIAKKQTLFIALKNQGLDPNDINQLIASLQPVVDFKRTKPGDKYEIHLDVDRRILKFVYEISPEDISIAERQGGAFVAHKVDVHKRVERILVKGELNSTLYQAFIDLGEKGDLASHFMQLFKYDFDFGSDSQNGDSFSMIVDKVTLNGQFYRYGRVWAANYTSPSHAKNLQAYYYDTTDGDFAGYYDEQGRALRRAFLKTPVVGCRVTSPYDLKRMHPILKRVRPHYGIDYGCQTGTPIMAFADGVVTFAGWKGGNGNLLVIQHAHGYTTLYAHLYGFATGIKKGTHVKQGQFVARIGNTGISTGPHLHFAVKLNDKYIDPASIDSTRAFSLTGNHMKSFIAKRDKLQTALDGQNGAKTDVTAEFNK